MVILCLSDAKGLPTAPVWLERQEASGPSSATLSCRPELAMPCRHPLGTLLTSSELAARNQSHWHSANLAAGNAIAEVALQENSDDQLASLETKSRGICNVGPTRQSHSCCNSAYSAAGLSTLIYNAGPTAPSLWVQICPSDGT